MLPEHEDRPSLRRFAKNSAYGLDACLTCDKFATDASFLPELQDQQERTGQLIEQRRTAFLTRTGEQMGEDNIWLAGRRQEHDALG